MISKTSAKQHITTHLGHGDPSSPFYYVGLEPGGSGTIDDLRNRIASFEAQGSPNLTNLRQELTAIGSVHWFAKERLPQIQKYWKRVAFFDILLRNPTRKRPPSNVEIAEYQRDVICAEITTGPLMLEISALPSPNTNVWPYGDMDLGLSELASRKAYEKSSIIEERLKMMAALIQQHSPKLVVFMGIRGAASMASLKKLVPNTRFELVTHPNTFGITNEEWFEKAKYLRTLL